MKALTLPAIVALLLTACVSSRKPSAEYRDVYVLKANSMVFGCWVTKSSFSLWFGGGASQGRCLGAGEHQPAPGAKVMYPKGTEVRILRIQEMSAPGTSSSLAVVSIGSGRSRVRAYAGWPSVLRLLEPAPNH